MRSLKEMFLVLAMSLTLAGLAHGDSVKEAFALNDAGDVSKALRMLDRLIDRDDPNAPYGAALIHLRNNKPEEAELYLLIADRRGDLRATYALAELMLSEQIDGSVENAFRLARKAANGGYREAQLGLANHFLYEMGGVGPVTLEEAVSWARAAYLETDLSSAYTLASLLSRQGMHSESHELFLTVAEAGEPQAQFNVGYNFMRGIGVAKNDQLAEKWILLAASQGVERSFLYAYAFLGKSNKAKAREYLERAMANDDAGAYYANYLDNLQGFTEPKNIEQAMQSLEKAAFLGTQEAIRSLATRYQNGDGVTKSNTKALFWLWKLDPEKYPMKDWEISAVEKQVEVLAKLDDFEPSDVLKPYLYSISRSFYSSQTRGDSEAYLDNFVIPSMASRIIGDTGLSGKRFSSTGDSIRDSDGNRYTITGNSIRSSDGTWGHRIGRSMFFSDGISSRSSRDGRSIRFSDGTSARISRDGKSTRFSDGTNCRSVGRSTWCY